MFDSKKLFEKMSSTAKKAINETQQIFSNVAQNQAEKETQKNSSYTMYEVFTASMGMGKKFVITENSLIYGNEEYNYSQLTPILLDTAPLANGIAKTKANGKEITLVFDVSQKERFVMAMVYANEQIDLANGTVRKYKFALQSAQGIKIEVYEGYLILHSGKGDAIIDFDEIDISVYEKEDGISLHITQGSNNLDIPLNISQKDTVQEIITYINNRKNSTEKETEYIPEVWEQIKGSEKEFVLKGEKLIISAKMDTFNTYRQKFNVLAENCKDKGKEEYDEKVQDLHTFLNFFPKIYRKYLNIVTQRAVDILISESVWAVTSESFTSQHELNYHSALDYYNSVTERIAQIVQEKQNAVSAVMSFVPNLSGGGFGLKGAAKGIATATAFNLVRDGVEAGLSSCVSKIDYDKQIELYNNIDSEKLFECVFDDYWKVYYSLAHELYENRKNIWYPTEKSARQANNIFQNLSNPNFPQDNVIHTFFEILKTDPYNKEYYIFMVKKFGLTEETKAIQQYFNM